MTPDAGEPAPDAASTRAQWSEAHGSIDPDSSMWISGWLGIVDRLTRPLVNRHVPPARVTIAGLLVSMLIPAVAWVGGGWSLLAVPLVVGAGLLDGIDGALARADGTVSAWGSVLDELVDRCSDLAMLAALGFLGAPVWLCVAAALLTLLLESVRSSARNVGLDGIGALTLWERPSRLIVTAFAVGLCGIAALVDGVWSVPSGVESWIASAGAVIAVVLAAASVAHLTIVVRRQLRAGNLRPARRAD